MRRGRGYYLTISGFQAADFAFVFIAARKALNAVTWLASAGGPRIAPLVVNELTYPGHLLIDVSAAAPAAPNGSAAAAPRDSLDSWLRGYRHGTRQPGHGSSHADALLARLGIAPRAFAQSDFLSMDRPRDANFFDTTRGTYDGSLASRCRPAECSALHGYACSWGDPPSHRSRRPHAELSSAPHIGDR